MYLKTSNKKQLAAAVTLAVMGMAWVAVPSQVWAADGGFGAINNPISLEIYADQNKSDGKLDKARKDYEGSNVYVSQYHSAYTDNEKIFASGDMTGKTISLSNMTVQAVVGEDGIGQAADLAQHATQGQAGGFGYGAGLVNQNGMSNAVIAVDSAEINVIGGASGLRVDGKYQHEGEQGLTGNAAIGGTGGAGAAGGNGGGAKAIGVAAGITDTAESIAVNGSASKNIQISGTSLTVNATGEAGGHGGYGGKGGSGADGAELTTKKADKGADGANGTDENTTPGKAANGEDKLTHADNGKVEATYDSSEPPEQTGWTSTAGTAGTTGEAGNAGVDGKNGGNADAGSAGSNGLAGNTGLAGGTGGAGANGGNGGSATAYGLHLNTISGGSVTLQALNVNATGGNGTAGGEGGKGITPIGTVAQSNNGAKAEAWGLVTSGGSLNVLSDSGLTISADAQEGSAYVTAKAVVSANSVNVYQVQNDLKITATAVGDQDRTETVSEVEYTYSGSSTSTQATAVGLELTGGSMVAEVGGTVTIEASTDWAGSNTATGIKAAEGAVIAVHSAGAMDISAEVVGTNAKDGTILKGANGILANGSTMYYAADNAAITVSGGKYADDHAADIEGGVTTFDAGTGTVTFNGTADFTNGTLNLKSDTDVQTKENSLGSLDISGTAMNLTDNLAALTVEDKTTLAGSTVYFYDENNQAEKYNTADYRTITTNDLDASDTNELFMRTNANGVYGQSAGNDKITSTNTVTGSGTYNITVFDQGMRNGYNNAAGADTKGHLDQDVVLIENADKGGTYNIKEMKYDNGVWAYEYEGKAAVVDNGLNLTQVTTRAATQSSAQMAAQDASKIAAGAAVTLFGADETLMERLGDVRNSADDNDGVWAKYVGGKIKVDGLQGDNDYQYNGFAAGYDREIGSNWRIGLAGQYAKGDTSLTNGDGEIKTAAGALYGTWTGDKGHHVDIIAKVGKVDSETSAYGGTIAQKLDGDFGSTAISFAVEYGYRQDLNDGWFVEPMVRASYVHLGGDDYTVTTRDNTMSVTNDSMNSIVLRGGFLLGKTFAADSSVYLKAAVLHDFDGDINTHVSADGRNASYSDSIGGTAIEYGIGVNHKFNKDSSMYLDVERISGGDVTKNWGVNVGFRYSF